MRENSVARKDQSVQERTLLQESTLVSLVSARGHDEDFHRNIQCSDTLERDIYRELQTPSINGCTGWKRDPYGMLANPKLAMKSRNLSCMLQKRRTTYFARENSGLCKR